VSDHAEIEQGDAVVACEEDISGVRIGVENTVHEDLFEVGFEELLDEDAAIDVNAGDRADGGDFAALHVVHGEDAARAVIRHGLGNGDVGELLQVGTDSDQVLRFGFVVELLLDGAAEFLEHGAETVAAAGGGVLVEEAGDFAEHLEVLGDLHADAGTLDFDDDLAAVAQGGGVDLAERSGGERRSVETGKRLGDAHAQFAHDNLLGLLVRESRDLVLKTFERLHVGGRDQVGPAGEDLADLDVSGPHRFEVVGELVGGDVADFFALFFGIVGFVETHVLHQIGTAVFPEKEGDLLVAFQVTERELHMVSGAGLPGVRDRQRFGAAVRGKVREGASVAQADGARTLHPQYINGAMPVFYRLNKCANKQGSRGERFLSVGSNVRYTQVDQQTDRNVRFP